MKTLHDFALNSIDWTLTPEQAVTMYLEWGNNNFGDKEHPPVRSKSDESLYFVVDSWQDPPKIRLVRRTMESAEDVCVLDVPKHLIAAHRKEHGNWRGISSPVPEIVDWLKKELGQD